MTTTSLDVESAWNTAIWTDATITAITSRIYLYPLTSQSEVEAAKFYGSDNRINYIEAITTRAEFTEGSAKLLGQALTYEYLVTINYYKEVAEDGTSFAVVRNFFETLQELVRTDLTTNWSNTVDFYRPQEAPADIIEVAVDGRRALRGTYRFTGTKSDTLT